MYNNLQTLIAQLGQKSLVNVESQDIFNEALVKADIIQPRAHLGQNMGQEFILRNLDYLHDDLALMEKITPPIIDSSLKLEELIKKQDSKVKLSFIVCMVGLFISFALILWGVLLFTHKLSSLSNNHAIITTISGMCVGLIDKFLFDWYHQEGSKAEELGKDLRLLQLIDRQFYIIKVIPDQNIRNQAYLKVIESANQRFS